MNRRKLLHSHLLWEETHIFYQVVSTEVFFFSNIMKTVAVDSFRSLGLSHYGLRTLVRPRQEGLGEIKVYSKRHHLPFVKITWLFKDLPIYVIIFLAAF